MKKIQKEILTGLMLGDGGLEVHKNGKNASLKVTRTLQDEEYNKYHFHVFNSYNSKCANYKHYDKRTNKTYFCSVLKTSVHPEFTQWYKKWYPDGKKNVPNDIKLTPTSLATWFADDGCIIAKPGMYHVKLATHGFSLQNVELLCDKLYCMNLEPKIYRDISGKNDHWFILFGNRKKVISFIKIIDPVFPKSMNRKSNIWRTSKILFKQPNPDCIYCKSNFVYKSGGPGRYVCQICKKSFRPSPKNRT